MIYNTSASFLLDFYKSAPISIPEYHIVLGSGLAGAVDAFETLNWKELGQLPFKEIPELGDTSVLGHRGAFKFLQHKKSGKIVLLQIGRFHGYEGHDPKYVVRPVLVSRIAGTQKFILTNAAGSLNPGMKAGSVMIISDHVNLTGQNPLVGKVILGFDEKPLGLRFPDMTEIYDGAIRARLKISLKDLNIPTHEGVYLGLLGPSFETPAEIKLFGRWGLDAVGMSTVWESLALKASGAKVAALSLISNLGCGLSDQPLNHEQILAATKSSSEKVLIGLFRFLESEFSK